MENQTQSTIEPQTFTQITESPAPKRSFPKLSLIIGLVLILILAGGTYFLGQKTATKTTEKTPIHTVTSPTPISDTTNADGTTGWKTFTAQSGVSFKYPSGWTPKEKITPKDSSGFGPLEGVTITSPNGIVINYSDHISGLGGGCDPADCPNNHILKVEPVNIPGYGTLNLVELVVKDSNDSSVLYASVGLDSKTYPNLQVGSTKQFGYNIMFNDKDPKKYLDQFSAYIYDSNSNSNQVGQLSDFNKYFTNPEAQTAETIIKTLKFTDQTIQNTEVSTPTPTPNLFVNWNKYSDSKYNFSFKYPADWTTQAKDFSDTNERLVNIIKNSSPSVVSLSFTIASGWDRGQFGNAQDQPKNYSVGGVPAYRMDPPTKAEKQLDRYQTNVYFEAPDGHVFVFICTHNWNQNYIDTCNNILSTFKFTQ